MSNLQGVVIRFNNEIALHKLDCYAIIEEGGFLVAVWLDGVAVVKMTANRKINFLLKPGMAVYKILNKCFLNESDI